MNSPIQLFTDFVFIETKLKKADAIFIPGSHHPQLAVRAAELFHAGYAPLIIPSGGANHRLPDGIAEALWLKNLLIELAVPESAIITEPLARNTFNNADFTMALIEKLQLNINSAIIVAKGFHSRRCLLTYQTAFAKEFSFFVTLVPDSNNNTKSNWYRSASGINTVMDEIRKIGQYFAEEIPEFAEKWVV
ncbi:MAG: YdcF family protein [Bacillota bacterium]